MAVVNKVRYLLRQRRGDEAVSFLLTTAMLVLIFATLVSVMIYIMQYYNASFICRRVVRSIEVAGKYDEAETKSILNNTANADLENVDVRVEAVYFGGNKIQLRQTFNVTLTASYKITILELGKNPIEVDLPIKVKVAGMSEVYWKQ
jgi:hypothetical protein